MRHRSTAADAGAFKYSPTVLVSRASRVKAGVKPLLWRDHLIGAGVHSAPANGPTAQRLPAGQLTIGTQGDVNPLEFRFKKASERLRAA